MTDPFAKFQIDHLSPSSLNCYLNEPAMWVLRYLYKFNDRAGPNAWRGNAVEAGVNVWLKNVTAKRNIDKSIAAALDRFERDAQGEISDKIEKELKAIPRIVQKAIEALHDRPIPDATQAPIEIWFDGIEVPVTGFIDYVWPKECIDLKSTLSMPSEPKEAHCRQVSVYSKAKGRPCHLLYATPTKYDFKQCVDIDKHLNYAHRQARSIRNLLWVCSCKEQVAEFFLPDFDNYVWDRDETKEAAAQIWR